jgi:adenylate kinase
MSTKYIVLLGLPGTGKGTLAQNLTRRFACNHISCGDIFRAHVKDGTGFGKLATTYIEQGKLTPDHETSHMFLGHLQKCRDDETYIIEGFPRTLGQARDFENHLNKSSRDLIAVIHLNAESESLVDRLKWRRICPRCSHIYNLQTQPPQKPNQCDFDGEALIKRADDQEIVVRSRLALYQYEEEPIVEFYRAKSLVRVLSANSSPESLADDALQIIFPKKY